MFLRWHQTPYKAVLDCGRGYWLSAGWIRLKKFTFPWGKFYFVGSRNCANPTFEFDETEALHYIRAKSGLSPKPWGKPNLALRKHLAFVGLIPLGSLIFGAMLMEAYPSHPTAVIVVMCAPLPILLFWLVNCGWKAGTSSRPKI